MLVRAGEPIKFCPGRPHLPHLLCTVPGQNSGTGEAPSSMSGPKPPSGSKSGSLSSTRQAMTVLQSVVIGVTCNWPRLT